MKWTITITISDPSTDVGGQYNRYQAFQRVHKLLRDLLTPLMDGVGVGDDWEFELGSEATD